MAKTKATTMTKCESYKCPRSDWDRPLKIIFLC